jgi:hypothetical protein
LGEKSWRNLSSVAKFERDSIGWQIDKLSHHWEEWLESNTNTIKPPDYEPPAVAMDWLLPFVYISAWLLLSVFLAWLGTNHLSP